MEPCVDRNMATTVNNRFFNAGPPGSTIFHDHFSITQMKQSITFSSLCVLLLCAKFPKRDTKKWTVDGSERMVADSGPSWLVKVAPQVVCEVCSQSCRGGQRRVALIFIGPLNTPRKSDHHQPTSQGIHLFTKVQRLSIKVIIICNGGGKWLVRGIGVVFRTFGLRQRIGVFVFVNSIELQKQA